MSLTFDWLSNQWKAAGFSSNTKVPSQQGGYIFFNDLTFKITPDTVVTLGPCRVNFFDRIIIDEQEKEYRWWTPTN